MVVSDFIPCFLRVTYGRDLRRKIDALGNLQISSLEGALEVNLADLLAEIGLCANETDEAVLHGQQNICTLLDGLLDSSLGVDNKLGTAMTGSASGRAVVLERKNHTPLGGWETG